MGKYFSLHHFVSHAKAKYPKWVFSSKNLRTIELKIVYDLSFQHEITYRLEKVESRDGNSTTRKIMDFAVIPYEHTYYKGCNRFLAGYTMHALISLFDYIAQGNDKSEEGLIAELVETIEESLIHAKNVTEARPQIVRYDGKGIVAKKSDARHPEDMLIVGKTKVIIDELQHVLNKMRSNGFHIALKTHEYCIQRLMSLIDELRDRELSAEEINLILKGESTNRLTTAPNLYEKFRDTTPQQLIMGQVTSTYALFDSVVNDVERFTEELEDKLNTINYNVEFLVERDEAPVVLQRMKEGTKIRIRTGVPTSQNW